MTDRDPTLVATDPARSRARWPWLLVACALGASKAFAYSSLLHHGWGWTVLLGAAVAGSLLRGRLVATAIFGAALAAVISRPHPVPVGLGVGVAAFALLLAVFVAVGTALRIAARSHRMA